MSRRRRRGERALRVLISAGPTREPIDSVRFLSNYSTGMMGACLATEALSRGHQVTVVCGPVTEPYPRGVRLIPVERSTEMARAMRQQARQADAVVMAAAVADFRPAQRQKTKLARHGCLTLHLRATPDIIKSLPRRPGQVVAGFALESVRVVQRARRKLQLKRLDLLLAQQAGTAQPPFGQRTVRAWLLERPGRVTDLGRTSKSSVARALLDKIEALWYGQPRSQHLC